MQRPSHEIVSGAPCCSSKVLQHIFHPCFSRPTVLAMWSRFEMRHLDKLSNPLSAFHRQILHIEWAGSRIVALQEINMETSTPSASTNRAGRLCWLTWRVPNVCSWEHFHRRVQFDEYLYCLNSHVRYKKLIYAANLLFFLSRLPYRKKSHGNGIITTVKKASKLDPH